MVFSTLDYHETAREIHGYDEIDVCTEISRTGSRYIKNQNFTKNMNISRPVKDYAFSGRIMSCRLLHYGNIISESINL